MKMITKTIRYAATILAIVSLTSSYRGRAVANEPSRWDEGIQNLTDVRHGIPAYTETKGVYRRDGQPLLEIELQAPAVVAVATQAEAWGYFQFPGIRSAEGGLLVATWSMHKDAASSYGKGGSDFRLSQDNGKTWYASDRPAPSGSSGLLIPETGERLSIRTPAAINVNDLQLPQPIGSNKEAYGRTFTYYRLGELPAELQGVYLNRYDKNGVWSEIHASLDDPGAARYTDGDLFPVVWWGNMRLLPDHSIVAGIYPMFYESASGGVDPSGVSFYRSTDYGRSWKILGKIPYTPDLDVDRNGDRRLALGYTEPAFEILPDGTFLCVMRTTDGYGNGPMYISRSSDMGVTWTAAKPFTSFGVLPKLLLLENGVLVLASGRPGVQLRFSTDGKGEQWTDPFEMLPFQEEKEVVSCGYPQLLATGPDRFLVVYSDFKYPNQENELRKAIKVREVRLTPFIRMP